MDTNKLKSREEIIAYNKELINNNNIGNIDCSWFQDKDVSYDCCNTLAFLFTEGHLHGIGKYEDLRITIPRYRTSFKEMCEKDRDTREKEWERICSNIQGFAFFKSDGGFYPELLQLIKLLDIIIYINYSEELDKFKEAYRDSECKELLQELLDNEQIQFTTDGIEYCFRDNFSKFNKALLESVIKPTDITNVKMDVF